MQPELTILERKKRAKSRNNKIDQNLIYHYIEDSVFVILHKNLSKNRKAKDTIFEGRSEKKRLLR